MWLRIVALAGCGMFTAGGRAMAQAGAIVDPHSDVLSRFDGISLIVIGLAALGLAGLLIYVLVKLIHRVSGRR
ncbi:MAG: hypothetical protein ACFCUW_11575 [Kiloniellaceae bacterium]